MHRRPFAATARVGLLWLAMAAGPVAPAFAASEPPSVVIVFDGSGSMWGKIDGDKLAKFHAGREALRRLLPQMSPAARLGLVSFGHRRKGDCSDAELIAAPDSRDQERINAPLEKLNPKGKGPLVLGMRTAAKALAGRTAASLVIIHDGADNCQQDACAAATEIAKAQPGLAIHTLGIGLEPEDVEKTSCIAAATGGKMIDARNAEQLDAAIGEVLKLVDLAPGPAAKPAAPPRSQPQAAPQPTAPAAQPVAAAGLNVISTLAADRPPISAPVRWRVFKGDGTGAPLLERTAAQLIEPLATGSYLVEARLDLAVARKTIEVGTAAAEPVRMVFNAGVLTPSAAALKDGNSPEPAVYSIRDGKSAAGQPAAPALWIGRGSGSDIVLPAGTYLVRAETGLVARDIAVTLEPGQRKPVDFVFGSGRLEVSAVLGDDGPPLDRVTFIVSEDDPDASRGRREIARSAATRPEFVLPAGTYYITARFGTAEQRTRIALSAGDVVKRTIPLGLSRLKLSTRFDKLPQAKAHGILSRVIRLDGDQDEAARSMGPDPEFLLPSGRYRVETQIGQQNARVERTMTLKAREDLQAAVPLEAGHVTLKIGDGLAGGLDMFWEVVDAANRVVWRTSQSEATMILASGRYVARLELRDRKVQRAFDVAAGEQKIVAMGPE